MVTGAQIGGAMEGLANAILSIVNYGVTFITLMLIYEIGRFVVGPKKAEELPGEVAGGIKSWFGGLKSKGHLPGTEEHAEKKKRDKKNALELAVGEFVAEKAELAVMEKVKEEITDLITEKGRLQGLAVTYPHAESEFRRFEDAVKRVHKDAEAETYLWRGSLTSSSIIRSTFKTQKAINKLIDDVKKMGGVPASTINELRADESKILALHKETGTKVKQLLAELDQFKDVAVDAAGTVRVHTPSPGPYGTSPGALGFDTAAAKSKLMRFNIAVITRLANELIQLQGTGTGTKPGIMRVLEDVMTRIRSI